MSMIKTCPKCGGRLVLPAFPGDGVYEPPHYCDLEARGLDAHAKRDKPDEGDYDLGLDGRPNRERA